MQREVKEQWKKSSYLVLSVRSVFIFAVNVEELFQIQERKKDSEGKN